MSGTSGKVVSCNAGYVKNTGENSCDIPEAGKYADSSGNEQSCDAITRDKGGFNTFLANMIAVNSAAGCDFSCNAGFLKSGRACNFPRKGKYVDVSGSEQSCGDVGGTDGGFHEFSDNTKGVSSATGCNFSCKSGYVKSTSGYTCTKGYPCSIDNGAGVKATSLGSCEAVDCNAGYDSVADSAQCQSTPSGFFSLADDKTQTACPTPPHSSATTTTGLSSAADCYNCNSGYLKNTARNTCDVPSKGTYVNAQGSESSCNPIRIEGAATASWIAGAAATAITCPFSCTAGYVKSGRVCKIPTKGKYADNGVEKSCSPITGGGFDDFAVNTGAVSTAAGCRFSCNAGFVKKTAGRACNIPDQGKYADNGVEKDCSPITGDSDRFNAFASNTGAVSAADGCDFSCNTGYVKRGRTCNIPRKGHYADNRRREILLSYHGRHRRV